MTVATHPFPGPDRVFFGYFSGCGCLGSILISIVLSLLLSMCFNVF